MKTILVVDDEQSIRESLDGILQDEGFRTLFSETGEGALTLLTEETPDLILLDIWLPGIDGLETLRRIRENNPEQLVIMMSGHGTIETAVKATKLGAYDFIEKPLSLEKVLISIENAFKVSRLVEENRSLRARMAKEYEMVGSSEAIMKLKEQITIAAPTSGWVLITGENGTGKELVARAIHHYSKRNDKPFVEVNCAAIPEELIESELFGHEKGAFTGATAQRKGKFDQAHEGTLFLDEIGDMSLKTQAKILRILQERKFERVGGNRTIEVDVRVIAATNKDLEEEIGKGNFRQDLYYRLNVLPFHVPPLRERREDISLLARHFLVYFCSKESRDIKTMEPDVISALTAYNWPGNVRELRNIVERLVIMSPHQTITMSDLPVGIQNANPEEQGIKVFMTGEGISLKQAREDFEKEFILQKLQENEGNISRTAEAIDMERSNLHRKIKSYGIDAKK
ncbi:MAG: sigma-54 dependent transcriptional regulator [Syntrophotalea acetylenica]|jgi:two-component system nitrogen regulation response regulator NtrX|uniref:Fis family transcriptional regulator n=1 Tax=Syntrophotalea acetylenica TaxID=29542 RepID=A0A1L3GH73_SYNAC|nr:sigma-54 dependent transcriptional regulator [Syntrophotalea acetylenica]APG25250.1 Fis family transcriptional regulator [Syntrophotalea acetylenica]APG43320.1 Fis family transcriptional regulator [Syntrophotalea acetylenica]MDD4457280.1 sigma-54 dependent transcriptional regulator [Syntrophotalea acetylenica]MDY0263448.1 sigma-54 dependent transcriptional regulator [Syntrophotalea acetylenica]